MFNLIENAVQQTPKDGPISIVAAAGGDEIEVKVIDSGPGIAFDELDRVFEPLWRGRHARAARPRDGAGLGLTIARSIVEAHGGRIYIAETSSSGTHIGFTLPRAPATKTGSARPVSPSCNGG